jgi:hypothetical protein
MDLISVLYIIAGHVVVVARAQSLFLPLTFFVLEFANFALHCFGEAIQTNGFSLIRKQLLLLLIG